MKVLPFSCAAVFAEDIRNEEHGLVTIVGVLPDNINTDQKVEGSHPVFPKLGVYVRIVLAVGQIKSHEIVVKMKNPSGSVLFNAPIDPELIKKEIEAVKGSDKPTITLVNRMVAAPFHLQEIGRYTAVVEYGGDEYLAGSLNYTGPKSD